MLEVQNENAEVVNNATIYAVKILNEVKASYAAFAERDFGTDIESVLTSSNNSNLYPQSTPTISNVVEPKDENVPEPNCLALVVRKDYNLTIVKNVFTTTGRLSWKIVLITAIINVLNMLF